MLPDFIDAGVVALRWLTQDDAGYWVGVPYWGKGHATAALAGVLGAAFRNLPLSVVHATHLARNPASGRVMAKCGMQFVGNELRAHRGGSPEPFCIRAIDRAAWTAGQRR